ncbi:peptidoglycan DD-metalloendopeptidase family protein [Streptomyces sp. NPDC047049]|uniref:peptidoglycan DD-metalloendopeptidase family protein n=1 Tax=Streptomyces sp. NPDC047049 TaxID=3156688 RepID=UPI0033C41D41
MILPMLFITIGGTSDGVAQAAVTCDQSSAGSAPGRGGTASGPDSPGTANAAYIDLPIRQADVKPPVPVSEIAPSPWVYPVPPPFNIGTRFGEKGGHWVKGHSGVDFPKPTGTAVYAAADGVVLATHAYGTEDNNAYGNFVIVLHADNVETMYAHLSHIDATPGARVKAGALIGRVGATGNVTGPHLHFEVRPMISGHHLPVNPEPYLSKAGVAKPGNPNDPGWNMPNSPAGGSGLACTYAGGLGGAVNAAALPALARKMYATVNTLQTQCPEMPVVWIFAHVMTESSWNPKAYTGNSNGGAAGLYQMGRPEWASVYGTYGDWALGAPPPDDNAVWDPATHLRVGIQFTCGHLRQMTRYLAQHPEKKIDPLDAMAVCHIAGCSRVTDSATGIPTAGEAGCGQSCVDAITGYIASIHKYEKEFAGGTTANAGAAGPIPVAVNLPAGPAPYSGGATGCSKDDPSGGRCLTGATAHGYAEITKAFPVWNSIGCQEDRSDGGEHPLGRACDFAPGPLGSRPGMPQLSQGWALAGWLRAHASELHVWYVIWQGRIWSVKHPEDQGGWGRPYQNGINDPTTITGGHYDHVHVSFLE